MKYTNCLPFSKYTNYALNKQSLLYLENFIIENNIKNIIECGSGLSTLLFSQLNLKNVLSLEHDEYWFNFTKKELIKLNTLNNIDLKLCRMNNNWFDLTNVNIFKADLILIDSPPGNLIKNSRYPALEKLQESISENTYIILDDFFRKDEKETVSIWLKEYSNLKIIDILDYKLGLILLKF